MARDYNAALTRAVDKATDATLLSDNWQYILDVCDKVSEEPEDGAKLVIELVEKRLQQRDANVQLRSLSLLTSIAENCGSRVKQEIASRQFTGLLLSKLRDATVHKEIKVKVVQVLTQLSESFQNDPSLRPIQDAYMEVERNYSQFFPPDKPQKFNLNNDRLKEEEDLKAAIALSLAENNQAPIPTSQEIQAQQQQQQPAQRPSAQSSATTQDSSFSRVRALYDSFSQDPADLHFRKGDIITVLDRVYKDWGKGSLRGQVGLFPFNYVTPLYDPTPEELIRESEKEAQILVQSRQVEKLLTILSSGNPEVLQSEEFQRLYQEIALVKPELGGLIEKYRVRRDELLDLHGKLKDATVKYEELTDPLKQQKYNNYTEQQHHHQQQQQQQQQQQPPSLNYQYQQPQPSSFQQQHPPQPQQRLPQLSQSTTGPTNQYPLQQTLTGQPQQQHVQPLQQQYTYQGPPVTTFQAQSPGSGPNSNYQRNSFIPETGQQQQQQPQGAPILQQRTGDRPYPSY